MPIMLPLTLIGVGYLIYQLFAGATLALPIALGVAAGFGASHIGYSPFMAFVIGALAFMAVIAASRFAALKLTKPQGRIALALIFALPAALVGYSIAHLLAALVDSTGVVFGVIAAAGCAAVAAQRMLKPAV